MEYVFIVELFLRLGKNSKVTLFASIKIKSDGQRR